MGNRLFHEYTKLTTFCSASDENKSESNLLEFKFNLFKTVVYFKDALNVVYGKQNPAYRTSTMYMSFLLLEGKTVPQDVSTASKVPMVIVVGTSGPSLGF